MPIVQNILHVQGGSAQAAALFDFIADRRYGRGSVDLSRITPMPPWVYRQPTNLDLLAKYGEENCSRGWCLQNWGVDQNTLRPQKSAREYDGGTSVRFQTADRDVRETDPQAVVGVQRPLSGLPVGQRRRGQPGGRGCSTGMAKR